MSKSVRMSLLVKIASVIALGSGYVASAYAANPDHYPYNCVKNNSGFITKINWYNAGQVAISSADGKNYTLSFTGTNTKSLDQNSPTLGYTRCNGTKNGEVVTVSVKGGAFLNNGLSALAGATAGAACLFMAGTVDWAAASKCGDAAGVAYDSLGAVLPDVAETFYAGAIPSGCELHVSGTAWKPVINMVQQSDNKKDCTAQAQALPLAKK